MRGQICFKSRLLYSTALIAVFALSASGEKADAQTANVLVSNVNVLNLLAPFLSLTGTPIGQQTLQANLQQSIAINNGASATLQGLAVSDMNLLGNASNSVSGLAGTWGVAANLAGGLPAQTLSGLPAGVVAQQPIGGYGQVLGSIYQTGVNSSTATTGPLANTVSLLTRAYAFTGTDLGVAKNYFANGSSFNGFNAASPTSFPAVAPAGYTLPTYNGLPNTTTSIYDSAYGGNYTSIGKNIYGDSRPGQVSSQINIFYPSAFNGITTNAAFPSGHTTYAFTDSILLGMLTPQLYQSMLMRASEYGNSRVVLGVHYPLDIIASRAFTQYDLAQAFTNPLYLNNSATTGSSTNSSTGVVQGGAINLPGLFTAAQTELSGYLSTQCGNTVATCATSSANTNPYAPSAANQALYQQRLTYGLPTLTYAQAPREAAPIGGPDASILLAPIYGGSTSAAKTLAPNGGIYGSLQTDTINQIIVNTEGQALAAFYGSALSYWTRIDLYSAIGYFQNVTGTITLASSDVVSTNVTVANTGVLAGTGTVGSTTVLVGGALQPGNGTAGSSLKINGNLALQSGALYLVQASSAGTPLTSVSGTAQLGGTVQVPSASGLYRFNSPSTILTSAGLNGSQFAALTTPTGITGQLSYSPTTVSLNLVSSLGSIGGLNGNQRAVGSAIDTALNAGGGNAAFGSIFNGNVGQNLTQAAGQASTGAQQTAFNAMTQFAGILLDPTIAGRGAPEPGVGPTAFAAQDDALAYASNGRKRSASERDAYAMVTKAPPLAAYDPRWSVWAAGFGGTQHTNGDVNAGTAATDSRIWGVAVGADYYFSPSTVAGFALAGGNSRYDLASNLGNGRADLFQAGAFVRHYEGPAYVAAALAYGWQDVTTSRIVTIAGFDQLQGRFNANALTGRAEGGYRFDTAAMGLTPYVAAQATTFMLPSYGETALAGGGVFALNYASKDVTATRTELGLRTDKSFVVEGALVTLRGRAAWAHDYNTDRAVAATFQSLPAASFTVNGAAQPHDLALASASAEIKWRNGFSVAATFEGELSDVSQTYTGKGVLRYNW